MRDWIDNKRFWIESKDDPPGENPLIYADCSKEEPPTYHHGQHETDPLRKLSPGFKIMNIIPPFELLGHVFFTKPDEHTNCYRTSIIDLINQVTMIPFVMSLNKESSLSLLLCNCLVVKHHVPHDIGKFSEHVKKMDPNGYLALEGSLDQELYYDALPMFQQLDTSFDTMHGADDFWYTFERAPSLHGSSPAHIDMQWQQHFELLEQQNTAKQNKQHQEYLDFVHDRLGKDTTLGDLANNDEDDEPNSFVYLKNFVGNLMEGI